MFAYRIQVDRVWREIDLRSLAELPREVVLHTTPDNLMWDCFAWGMIRTEQLLVLDHAPMRRVKRLFHEWQQDSGIEVEEIAQMLALIKEHSLALEADLLALPGGLRLRDCPSERFNWRDLWAFITYARADTNIVGATSPDKFAWDRTNMLLADVADGIDWLCWTKSEDAQNGGSPPQRRPRPGIKVKEPRKGSRTKPVPVSRIREVYGVDTEKEDNLSHQRKVEAVFK